MAEKYDMAFLETSAKENINIDKVFQTLAKNIKVNILDKFNTKPAQNGP